MRHFRCPHTVKEEDRSDLEHRDNPAERSIGALPPRERLGHGPEVRAHRTACVPRCGISSSAGRERERGDGGESALDGAGKMRHAPPRGAKRRGFFRRGRRSST
ncbi:hypothetical protein NL676_002195 [Syzygium grande]|nr:hypothetical protein NL676_002195 [Syzygium grande]